MKLSYRNQRNAKNRRLYWSNFRILFSLPVKNINHPSPKPIAVIMQLLIGFSKEKSVLDPFAGSGTTIIACERLNRRWIGIEISEEYCEIAAKRIENERKQLKMF